MAAAVGEKMISEGAAQSVGYLEARFRQLHAAFTAQRAAWLAGLLQSEVLGTLPEDLLSAANLTRSAPFEKVEALLFELQRSLRTCGEAASK